MALGWKLALLGLKVSGDLAGMTIYTDRFGRKNWYPIAPPKHPPTHRQLWNRNRFKAAQAMWSALSDDDKRSLEQACLTTSLPFTGQNLFISCSLRYDQSTYDTVARQSGLTLPALAPVS